MAVVFSCQEGLKSLRENFCLGTSALGEDKDDAVTGWKTPNSMGLDWVGEGVAHGWWWYRSGTGPAALELNSPVAGMLVDRVTLLLGPAQGGEGDIFGSKSS